MKHFYLLLMYISEILGGAQSGMEVSWKGLLLSLLQQSFRENYNLILGYLLPNPHSWLISHSKKYFNFLNI